jgi:hypothetical protein
MREPRGVPISDSRSISACSCVFRPAAGLILVVARSARVRAGARKAMSEMADLTALLMARQMTSVQAPNRGSMIPAHLPISRRKDWRTWPEEFLARTACSFGLAETYDFKLGGREGCLGPARQLPSVSNSQMPTLCLTRSTKQHMPTVRQGRQTRSTIPSLPQHL